MYENIKELLNNSKYNEAKDLIEEELKNNDSPDLWYLLFLAENNNYFDFEPDNIKNKYTFEQVIKANRTKHKVEYTLFTYLAKYKNLGNIFRLIQIDKIDEAKKLLKETECPSTIDTNIIMYLERVIFLKKDSETKYLFFLEFLLKETKNSDLDYLFEKIKSLDPYYDVDSDKLNTLGDNYFFGEGVNHDYMNAVYYYELSAKKGNAKAQYALGNCYENAYGVAEDISTAAYYYEQAANNGHPIAQYKYGNLLIRGKGVAQDYEKAFKYFELSAKQGNSSAQNNLGNFYFYGEGIEQDYKKAVYYYEIAAKQGNALAQNNLGVCYETGQGVKKDYKKALYWYEQASNNGNENGTENYNSLRKRI